MATYPAHGMLDKESKAGAIVEQVVAENVGATFVGANTLAVGSLTTFVAGIGGIAASETTNLVLEASGSDWSSMRFTTGSAPSAPVNGDVWFDGTSLKIRIAGVTKTFTVA